MDDLSEKGFAPPADVLLVLRQNRDIQWNDLREKMEAYAPGASPSIKALTLLRTLEGLKRAGIISFDTDDRFGLYEGDSIKGPIRLTSSWQHIQSGLNISLVELAKQSRPGSMTIRPLFGRPSSQGSQIDLFVLMPFAPELKPVFDDHIRGVANSLSLHAVRGDDLFSTGTVIEDIWVAINSAKVIIADCTGRNPNVFYELGMAHTIGKEVVLITQDIDDIPFDVRHIRFIVYEYTPRGMKEFGSAAEKDAPVHTWNMEPYREQGRT